MENMKKIGFGMQLSKGLMIGIRHFEPDDNHNYYEIHIHVIFVVLFVTIHT